MSRYALSLGASMRARALDAPPSKTAMGGTNMRSFRSGVVSQPAPLRSWAGSKNSASSIGAMEVTLYGSAESLNHLSVDSFMPPPVIDEVALRHGRPPWLKHGVDPEFTDSDFRSKV